MYIIAIFQETSYIDSCASILTVMETWLTLVAATHILLNSTTYFNTNKHKNRYKIKTDIDQCCSHKIYVVLEISLSCISGEIATEGTPDSKSIMSQSDLFAELDDLAPRSDSCVSPDHPAGSETDRSQSATGNTDMHHERGLTHHRLHLMWLTLMPHKV